MTETSPLYIRTGTEADLDDVVRLFRDEFENSFEPGHFDKHTVLIIRDQLENGLAIVAQLHSQVIGAAACELHRDQRGGYPHPAYEHAQCVIALQNRDPADRLEYAREHLHNEYPTSVRFFGLPEGLQETASKKDMSGDGIVVEKQYREQGIGGKLIDACIGVAKVRGAKWFWAPIDANGPSVNLSKARGFVPVVHFDHYLPDGTNTTIYVKQLY